MTDRNETADLTRLATAFFANLKIDNCEFGGIGIDSKRPFGNSWPEGDILEIIGWEPETVEVGDFYPSYTKRQIEYARDLYHEKLIPFLQRSFHQWSEMPR